tara:strand:- start:136 stop:246 length:111 start_codon:yes stop_codon:yes gene_type:complete
MCDTHFNNVKSFGDEPSSFEEQQQQQKQKQKNHHHQ